MNRVLFLPGAGGCASFWQSVGEQLPSTWDKHYLSWPGLGNEPSDPGVSSWDNLLARVEHAVGDGPADIVAQSMGGVLALQVALRHPGRVRRLILVATSGGLDIAGLGGADWRPAYQLAFPRAARWVTQVQVDLTTALATLAQPTLLIWGDADPISPVAVGEQLRRTLPNARLLVVPGGDHDLARARAAEIATPIRDHLAET